MFFVCFSMFSLFCFFFDFVFFVVVFLLFFMFLFLCFLLFLFPYVLFFFFFPSFLSFFLIFKFGDGEGYYPPPSPPLLQTRSIARPKPPARCPHNTLVAFSLGFRVWGVGFSGFQGLGCFSGVGFRVLGLWVLRVLGFLRVEVPI